MFKRFILFGLVLCLPFQLGYHFWLPQSFVSSFRVDYLSPTLYLVDLLILVYLTLHFRISLSSFYRLFTSKFGLLFLFLVSLNLWSALGNPIVVFAWARLLEYYLLFQVLRVEKELIPKIKTPFLLSLVIIMLIALFQFLRQSSLGGLFYFLGERPLSLSAPNIAKMNFSFLNTSIQILRPYSTFSHPNSLAGYLLITLILLPLFTRSKLLKAATSIVILLTFSKAAILALILIEVFHLSFPKSLTLSLALSLLPLLQGSGSLPSWLRLSFTSRHFLILPSLQIIKERWLAGVGLRQFVPHLPTVLPGNQLSYLTLQPVHNTFLLIATEIGLIGLIILIKLVSGTFLPLFRKEETRNYLVRIGGVIFLTGSLDHYWWTLPQNQLIIVLALALITDLYELRRNHY